MRGVSAANGSARAMRGIVCAFRNPYPDTMGGLTIKVPQKGDIAAWQCCCNVGGRIPQANRENLRCPGRSQQGATERKNSSAIGCCAFRKDRYYSVRMFSNQSFKLYEAGVGRRLDLRLLESVDNGLKQRNGLDKTSRRIRGSKDWVEDRCKIQGVDRGCKR